MGERYGYLDFIEKGYDTIISDVMHKLNLDGSFVPGTNTVCMYESHIIYIFACNHIDTVSPGPESCNGSAPHREVLSLRCGYLAGECEWLDLLLLTRTLGDLGTRSSSYSALITASEASEGPAQYCVSSPIPESSLVSPHAF